MPTVQTMTCDPPLDFEEESVCLFNNVDSNDTAILYRTDSIPDNCDEDAYEISGNAIIMKKGSCKSTFEAQVWTDKAAN